MSPTKSKKKDKGGKRKRGTAVVPPPAVLPKSIPKNRAHGADWSVWDINDNSFKKTKGKGFKQGDFAFLKLIEGEIDDAQEVPEVWNFRRDADIRAEQWKLIKEAEIRGAFHYLRSGQSWRAQADHFLGVLTAEAYDFHIYALDLEGEGTPSVMSFSATRAGSLTTGGRKPRAKW